MNQSFPKPSDSELEILKVLWGKGPSTVRRVNEELNRQREVGYTTTLKILQIMHEKGFVSRTQEGKSHIYTAELQESDTQKALLSSMMNSVFGGSASKLVIQALGNRKTSREELRQIREFLDKLEENDNGVD